MLLHIASTECLPSSEHLSVLQTATNWALNLDATIQISSSLRQKLLVSLTAKEVHGPLLQFVNSRLLVLDIGVGHIAQEICPRVQAETRLGLHRLICELLLKTTFYSSADGTSFDATIGLALLEKRTTNNLNVPLCEYHNQPRSSSSNAPVSLFEASSTPQTMTNSYDWRNRLNKELARDAKHQYDSIVMMMGGVYQDLERRCDEAELPLRAEQMKNSNLTISLDASQAKLAELERKLLERNQLLGSSENERDCLQGQVLAFEQRAQSLSSRITDLEQEARAAKEEAHDAAEAARETAIQQELTHLASMTEKDELLEEQGFKLTKLGEHAGGLQNELAQVRLNETSSYEKIKSLEEAANKRDETLEQLRAANASSEVDISRLTMLVESLKNENQKLRVEVCNLPMFAAGSSSIHTLQAQELAKEHNTKTSELEAQFLTSRKQVSDLQKGKEEISSAKHAEVRPGLALILPNLKSESRYLDFTHRGNA